MRQIWKALKQRPELLAAGLMLALMMNGVVAWMRATDPGVMIRVAAMLAINGVSIVILAIILCETRRVDEDEFLQNVFKNKPEGIEEE